MLYAAGREIVEKNTLVQSWSSPYVANRMGHHLVDVPASDLATGSAPVVEPRPQGVSAIYTSSDRIAVPPHAVEILRDGIGARKTAPVINERIREALVLICEEAHRADAMPEHVLVTLKELCHSMPEYERIRGAREREAFLGTLVTTAIEEYYRV